MMSTKIPFVDAMYSQPTSLELAYSTLRLDLERCEPAPWQAGETIGVVAMGASSHSGHALVAVLAAAGVRAVNLVASDLVLSAPGFQPADHYVIVSESGRSPEPIAAGRALTVGRRIGISNFPTAPLADVVDTSLSLGGFDDSGVYTSGYTATLLAYALLLDRMGAVPAGPQVARIPDVVKAALETYDDVATRVARIVADASSIDVIGRGTSFASAAEAALMFREGLRIPSAGYETYQYLHGPMEPLNDSTVLLVYGDGRELTVPDTALTSGAHVVLVTAASERDIPSAGHPRLTIVPMAPDLDGFVRPIVEIVIAQLVMAHAIENKSFTLEDFLFTQSDTKLVENPVAD
jgi:glucosamine--fructose-6-phosphate aminotransferase (isomerizing)